MLPKQLKMSSFNYILRLFSLSQEMTNRGIRYLKVNSAGKVTNPFAASLTALKHTSRQNVVFEVISHSDLLNACILLLVAATRFNYVLLFTVPSSCRYLLTNFPFLFTC